MIDIFFEKWNVINEPVVLKKLKKTIRAENSFLNEKQIKHCLCDLLPIAVAYSTRAQPFPNHSNIFLLRLEYGTNPSINGFISAAATTTKSIGSIGASWCDAIFTVSTTISNTAGKRCSWNKSSTGLSGITSGEFVQLIISFIQLKRTFEEFLLISPFICLLPFISTVSNRSTAIVATATNWP